MPVGLAAMLLAFCVAGAPLFASSAGSGAIRQQLDDLCPSDTALSFSFTSGSVEQRRFVEDLGRSLVTVDPARRQLYASVQIAGDDGLVTRGTLFSLPGQGEQVSPPFAPLGLGEVALSATNAKLLGVGAGDVLATADGVALRVAAVFDDLPVQPVPDFWCGWSFQFVPNGHGDPPSPSALASPETVASFEGALVFDEYRIVSGPLTLSEARAASAAFDEASVRWRQRPGPELFPRLPPPASGLGGVVGRASAVSATVERTIDPVELTAVSSLTGVLVAVSVLLARARRRELRLLVVRGVPLGRVAARAAVGVAPAMVAGAVVGAVVAYGAVRLLGPSTIIESHAVVVSGVVVVAATLVATVVVSMTVALAADHSVDGIRRASRWAFLLAGAVGLVGLAVVSLWRLDRVGGIRTFGVESRGGGLLPMGFPLFALLAISVVAAVVLVWLAPRLRLTGAGRGRAVRLGWRRVVLEGGPLAAIVAAVALAAGSFVGSWELANASQVELRDKAQVYAGADLAAVVYDDPVVASGWVGSPSSIELTGTAKLDGTSVDLVGIDRTTFASVARLRDDASSMSLPELVSLLTPAADGPAAAIAVGTDLEVGDVTTLDARGATDPLWVEVVATPTFFPGKTSGAALIVVDDSVTRDLLQFPTRVLLVRNPPAGAVEALHQAGVRTGVVRSVDSAFDGSAYSALRWAYAPMAVLGALFTLIAVALQLLVVAARAADRKASHALLRRTGFSTRQVWVASLVETSVPLALGAVIGVAAAVVATTVAVPHLDPMPTLQPVARVVTPWWVLAAIALAVLLWATVVAAVITRLTVRSDPMEVMHGTL